LLVLPSLPAHSDLREGDVLVTSGLGDRFPAGFPVAEVSHIERDTGGAFARVEARPLAALDRGREVLLVVPNAPHDQVLPP
jgi:rod shape-determining protein MreC